jgi:hypothetical protein
VRAVVTLALVAAASPARAGDFCAAGETLDVLARRFQAYAEGRPTRRFDTACVHQVGGDDDPRILAACQAAVVLPVPRRTDALDGYCVLALVGHGVARVGARDLAGELLARWSAISGWEARPPYALLVASGDPRVRGFVVAHMEQARASWARSSKRRPDDWMLHKRDALRALAQVGTRDDLALIDALGREAPTAGWVQAAARAALDAVAARSP